MHTMPRLQQLIQENRILIGPWYILPDEFLVSPEATIRNLLVGKKLCEIFGQRMMVGYIPDPFGHISQMPQILLGFHIDTACLWRGVPDGSPTLLWWQAPDGSHVLLAHLYTSYGNGAHLPALTAEETAQQLQQAVDALAPFNPIEHTLIMRGSDHLEPQPELPKQIKAINKLWQEKATVLHSTLPAYLSAATEEIKEKSISLETISGELRNPHKAHMLPGVLSSRMWIKQRNHASQTALERWVEPFSTWAELVSRGEQAFTQPTDYQKTSRIADPGSLIHQAWKYLLTNHPHDSICGCSVDQTHREMLPRFDQVDQIAAELTDQSLHTLTNSVDSRAPAGNQQAFAAITVYNAAPYSQSGVVQVKIDMPDPHMPLQVIDESGAVLPASFSTPERDFIEKNTYPISELPGLISTVTQSGYNQQRMVQATLSTQNGQNLIEAEFSNTIAPDEEALMQVFSAIVELIQQSDPNTPVQVMLRNTWAVTASFFAPDVPAVGFRTFWVEPAINAESFAPLSAPSENAIENEFLRVIVNQMDGSISVLDKRTKSFHPGLHTFIDVGDRGDEYNFNPVQNDSAVKPVFKEMERMSDANTASLLLRFAFPLPLSLDASRKTRSTQQVLCQLSSRITLSRGVARIDIHSEFDNLAKDHRLSVHFPTNLQVQTARTDAHFDVVERSLDLPAFDQTWVELPRPEVPQRLFTDVSTESAGMMIANQGLPEVAVLRRPDGTAEIALTLLRCVGWLSRDDLSVRKGHAGPGMPTPDAQENASYTFDYAIIPHAGDWRSAAVQAHTFQTPLRAQAGFPAVGNIPSNESMVQVNSPDLLITAIKAAEYVDGWIVRGVNLAAQPIQLTLKPFRKFENASRVYLDESHKGTLTLSPEGEVGLEVNPYEIVTVLFTS
jgi:alpha-mannosidase